MTSNTEMNKNTQSNESNIFQGKRNVTDFLPVILQTTTNKKFFETTLDQLLSSGSMQSFDAYWGKISGSNYDYEKDVFNLEKNALRQNYQFSQGIFVNSDVYGKKALSYINIINKFTELGYNTGNLNSLFTEEGYTLDLPIDLDMFINYSNYFWLPMDIPVCKIEATSEHPINFDNIEKLNTYTTPILSNGKSLSFLNGMRITFSGNNITGNSQNFELNAIYMIEGVGKGRINLIKQYDSMGNNLFPRVSLYTPKIPTEWDSFDWQEIEYDTSIFRNIEKEYVVIERSSLDKNTWARMNQWHNIYAIEETLKFLDIKFSSLKKTALRGSRPIIQFFPNIELYDSGRILKYFINHHFDGNINPQTEIVGKKSYNNNGFQLDDGDIVLFTNNKNSTYNNKIFVVSNYGVSIELSQLYDINSFNEYDKALLLHSNKKDLINNELYWIENTWKKGQQKEFRGSPPLFNLYDYSKTNLGSYEGNDFYGNKIFSYYTSESFPIDRDINLRVKTDNNSSNDYVFLVDIIEQQYFSNSNTSEIAKIDGDYFYKNLKENILYSIWSPLQTKQRLLSTKTIVIENNIENLVIEAAGNPDLYFKYFISNINNEVRFYYENSNEIYSTGRKNESLTLMKDTDYVFVFLTDNTPFQITDPFGNNPVGITISGTDEKNIRITDSYSYDLFLIKLGSKEYNVFLEEKNSGYRIFKNGVKLQEQIDYFVNDRKIEIISDYKIGDIFELKYVSIYNNSDTSELAPIMSYNPNNKKLTQLNYSNIFNHVSDIFQNLPNFQGSVNGFNNYHKILKNNNSGGTIRQQIHSPINHIVLSNYEDTDPLAAITKVAEDYAIFKNYFKSKILQLWNTHNFDNIHTLVDKALEEMNIGKNIDFKYSMSDMIYYDETTAYEFDYDISTNFYDIKTSIHNYGDKNIHVYVWAYELYDGVPIWKILKNNQDYIIDFNKLRIIRQLNVDNNFVPKLKVKIYDKQTFNSYVPFSPCKMGFTQPSDVIILNDKLICHDGSVYKLKGDIFKINSQNFDVVGSAIYDFETRIYNSLIDSHFIVDDIRNYLPKKTYNTSYDFNDINELLKQEFNHWSVDFDYDIEVSIENVYDGNNKFTWNFSTVSGFASWKQLYKHVFGTDRPHTHPWEMLGHYNKPSWWNTWYSWDDPIKRDRLIRSLKIGLRNEPNSQVLDINPKYAIYYYDWDNNILVDINGDLKDPVEAGLVTEPEFIDASKRFNFGDGIDSLENAWKNSSEYLYSLIKVIMKLKPFEIFEKYWKLNNIITLKSPDFGFNYKFFKSQYDRNISNNRKMHCYTSNGEIENVKILNSGSGYTQAEAIIKATNQEPAIFDVAISDGKIQSIKIINTGFGYKEDASDIIIEGDGTGSLVVGFISTNRIKTVLGINSAIVENISSIDKSTIVESLLNSSIISSMCHLGGYTDKQNIDLILDGSYKNGQIYIPKEDYFIFLNKNPVIYNKFYSGIRFEKNGNLISVYGYNKKEKKFIYYPPNKNSQSFIQTINGYQLLKYKNYKTETSSINYGHTFTKKQDLYDFILGLNEYYTKSGFKKLGWEQESLNILSWSLSNDDNEYFSNGIVLQELTFDYGTHGYIDPFEKNNKIINKDGSILNNKNINIIRNEDNVIIKTRNGDIYGIDVKVSEFEHILIINTKTAFGDIVSDPITGLRQSRIRLRGQKTKNWNGKLEANGYIVSNNSIFNNYDSNIREIERDINNVNSKFTNNLTKKTNRFTVGYQEPLYLTSTFIDENNSYLYNIGERKYKGTKFTIDSFMRNKNIFGTNIKNHDLSEDWMILLGNYGDKRKSDPIQVEISSDLIKSNPQTIQFSNVQKLDRLDDQIVTISKNDKNYISGNFEKVIENLPVQKSGKLGIKDSKVFEKFYRNAGLPLLSEVEFKIKSVDDLDTVFDINGEYATISDWSSVTSYKKGDIVRKDGKVYKLKIEQTGLNTGGDPILINGSVTFPTVPSGSTLIIGTNQSDTTEIVFNTITFEKTSLVSSFNPIIINGTINNPVINVGDTLIIDNNIITFVNPSQNIVFNPTLNAQQIVNQINSAKIFGISARVKSFFLAEINTGNIIEINSTNPAINIGQGTANSKIGILSGLIRATSTQIIASTELSLFEIVQQINDANIQGISAISLNNKLQIQSLNSELVIGDGTANSFLGFNPLFRPAREFVENEFDEADWETIDDPVNISVWTIDNIGQQPVSTNRNIGYGVYRTFDFNFNIEEICEGVESGDDALITVSSPHNLQINDYVIIVNSTSTPSIDGIHKVTNVFTPTSFLIDKYIEEKGFSGKVLRLNQVRFPTSNDLFNTIEDQSYTRQGFGWKPGMIAYVDSIIENGVSTGIGGVYICVENVNIDNDNAVSFELIRKQTPKTNNYSILNAKTYDGLTYSGFSQLEVFDPYKGIIPGIVDKEIEIKYLYDIALYNNTTDSNMFDIDEKNYWGEKETGARWWDLSNAIYLDYEQDSLEYRQGNWGKLFPTSSIDIYEWTKSPVTPDEYINAVRTKTVIDGIELTGEPYSITDKFGDIFYYWSEETKLNTKTGEEETFYYFWVKNKITIPSKEKNYSIFQLATIIENPTENGIEWVAACDQNTFLFSNLERCIKSKNTVLQINFNTSDVENHKEYILLNEKNNIPEFLHNIIRDGLAGYDRNEKSLIYDIWDNTSIYEIGDVIYHNDHFYIATKNNQNEEPFVPVSNNMVPPLTWKPLVDVVSINEEDVWGIEKYGYTWDSAGWDKKVWDRDFVNELSNIGSSITITAPNKVPNQRLHRFNRYGTSIRPRQSVIKNLKNARREFIKTINNELKKINLLDNITSWSKNLNKIISVGYTTYDLRKLWKFVDWASDEYNPYFKERYIVDTLDELLEIDEPLINSYARVKKANNLDPLIRQSVYKFNGAEWILIYKEKTTIEFVDDLWNTNEGNWGWDDFIWDSKTWDDHIGYFITYIFDILRDDIFFGPRKNIYSKIWFNMLNYIHSEHDVVEWAIKSSYIRFIIEKDLKDFKKFKADKTDLIIDYINQNKPFKTKIKDFIESNSVVDITNISVSELDRVVKIDSNYNRHNGYNWNGDTLIKGGDNWEIQPFIDKLEINDIEDFVYDGSGFYYPEYKGYDEELLSINIQDSVVIKVIRNESGNIENNNTKTLIMFIDNRERIETSLMTNDYKTTLVNDLNRLETTIELENPHPVETTNGSIWIGYEKISYQNVDENVLYNCVRGIGKTFAKNHEENNTVFYNNKIQPIFDVVNVDNKDMPLLKI